VQFWARHHADKMSKRVRGWGFTHQNPTEEDRHYMELITKWKGVKYVKFQRERGTTVHLQGVVIFKSAKTKSAVRKLGLQCHWTPLNTVPHQINMINYCGKEETRVDGHEPLEYGDAPNPGRRNDVMRALDLIKEKPHITHGELAHECPATARMVSFVKQVKFEQQKPRRLEHPCEGIWLWGQPNQGKSHMAFSDHPTAFEKDGSTIWFDGYAGEKTVILDEFTGGIPLKDVQRWTDRWPCKVQTKGGHVQLQAERIVITSNQPPWELYPNVAKVRRKALLRRFEIYEVKNRNKHHTPTPIHPLFEPHTHPFTTTPHHTV